MSDEPKSKQCGGCGRAMPADAPQGLCPACLMERGLDTRSAGSGAVSPPPPTPAELAPFFADLDIAELLGRGGMGAVYKARQKKLDRWVALKILPPAVSRDPQFSERFSREALALARLNHPNIVTIHDFGESQGLYYFVMEYVDGVNLRQLLHRGRISPREALAIVPQICDALQYAHDHGIVHRDIKPENILVDRAGRVKVADFGVAKLVERTEFGQPDGEGSAIGNRQSTIGNTVLGTPSYMAPEQADRPQDVDHRADIYSLGVVLYQMLTGELPGRRIEPPSHKVMIDVRLDEVVLRAMEREPERRYQQVSEIKNAVTVIAETAPPAPPSVPPAPPGSVPPQARAATVPARPGRMWWAAAAISVVVALAAVPALWLAVRSVRRRVLDRQTASLDSARPVPESRYGRALLAGPDLRVRAGPHTFALRSVVRNDRDGSVQAEDGRSGLVEAPALATNSPLVRQAAWLDVAQFSFGIESDDPPSNLLYDVVEARVYDPAGGMVLGPRDRRRGTRWELLDDGLLEVRSAGYTLPGRLDLWFRVRCHTGAADRVLVPLQAGATAEVDGDTLTVREVRAGKWNRASRGWVYENGRGCTVAAEWGHRRTGADRQVCLLDRAGRRVAARGMGTLDHGRSGPQVLHFAAAAEWGSQLELRRIGEQHDIVFTGVRLPAVPPGPLPWTPPLRFDVGGREGSWESDALDPLRVRLIALRGVAEKPGSSAALAWDLSIERFREECGPMTSADRRCSILVAVRGLEGLEGAVRLYDRDGNPLARALWERTFIDDDGYTEAETRALFFDVPLERVRTAVVRPLGPLPDSASLDHMLRTERIPEPSPCSALQFRLVAEPGSREPVDRLAPPPGSRSAEPLPVLRKVLLDGTAVSRAGCELEGEGRHRVMVEFSREGRREFERITATHTNRQLAVVYRGALLCAPMIREPIAGGQAAIAGSMPAEEVHALVDTLNRTGVPSTRRAFSPDTEVVLPWVTSNMSAALDLDTGQVLTNLPAREEPSLRPLTDAGGDLAAWQEATPYDLSAMQTICAPGWNGAWERCSAADVFNLWPLVRGPTPPAEAISRLQTDAEAHFFATREGARGILRVLGVSTNPAGLRLQYRTVILPADARNDGSPEAPEVGPSRVESAATPAGPSVQPVRTGDAAGRFDRSAIATPPPTSVDAPSIGPDAPPSATPGDSIRDASSAPVQVSARGKILLLPVLLLGAGLGLLALVGVGIWVWRGARYGTALGRSALVLALAGPVLGACVGGILRVLGIGAAAGAFGFLAVELAALVMGIGARRSVSGKAAIVVSAVLLVAALLAMA